MQRILTGLGVLTPSVGDCTEDLDICMGLQLASRSAGKGWVERTATLSDFELATDVVVSAKRRKLVEEESTLT